MQNDDRDQALELVLYGGGIIITLMILWAVVFFARWALV